jgi:hypothetical protein
VERKSITRLATRLAILFIGAQLCAACGRAAPSDGGATAAGGGGEVARTADSPAAGPPAKIFLACANPNQAVAASEIKTFPVVLSHAMEGNAEIDLSLATIEGATWKAALCFEDLCFMHDGKRPLQRTVSLDAGEQMKIEIKVLVPAAAHADETKTLSLESSIAGEPDVSAAVNLTAYLP